MYNKCSKLASNQLLHENKQKIKAKN